MTVEQFLKQKSKEECPQFYFSSKALMREMGITRYKARKELKELRGNGVVEYLCYGGGCHCNINESTPYCECDGGMPVWGWFYKGENKNNQKNEHLQSK